MSSKKATPQAPPKDGGIMRFFSATPKKLPTTDSASASPSAPAAPSPYLATTAKPASENAPATPRPVAPPVPDCSAAASPAQKTPVKLEAKADESKSETTNKPEAAAKAEAKSETPKPKASEKKTESKSSSKSKSKAPATKRRVITDDDDEKEEASESASASSDSESSASEDCSSSGSDSYSSDSNSSDSSGSDDDDSEDSDAPRRKGKSKKAAASKSKSAGKSSAKARATALNDDDDDDDDDGDALSPQKRTKPALGSSNSTLASMDQFRASIAAAAAANNNNSSSSSSSSAPKAFPGFGGASASKPKPAAAAASPSPVPKPAASKSASAAAAGGDSGDDSDDGGGDGSEGEEDSDKPAALLSAEYSFPDFSLPAHRRDAAGKRPGDEGYDPRTLRIPEADLRRMTPAQRQYWEIKAQNMDVVLFFKMGKFYELFDFDAETGIRELNLARMGGERLHVGFPESAYAKYAEILVKRGYRVGRVEQTQTPKQLAEANAKAAKGQKSQVVRREMCSILTQATIVDQELLGRDDAVYLLSLSETPLSTAEEAEAALAASARDASAETFARVAFVAEDVLVGVCFVDTATGVFTVGAFVDDRQRSRLRTLLECTKPAEVLSARGALSPATEGALRATLPAASLRTTLVPGSEFWAGDRTVTELVRGKFFDAAREKRIKDVARELPPRVAEDGWPFLLDALRTQLQTGKSAANIMAKLVSQSSGDASLAAGSAEIEEIEDPRAKTSAAALFSALGGVVWYLQRLKLADELVSLGNFRRFDPAVQAEFDALVLDGQTLANLEVLQNQDGGAEGTMLKHLDQCVTAFGKRLMRQWVARPLGRVAAINERLDAVEELMAAKETVTAARAAMKKLPDVERLLARVRANGTKKDNAVMYENVGKAKVELFIKTLDGFAAAIAAIDALAQRPWKSSRLRALTHIRSKEVPDGAFPEIATLLSDFRGTFNAKQAREDGFIVPQAGFVEDFDTAKADVAACERELEEYLGEVRREFGDTSIKYHHRAKEVYQLEISVDTLKRRKAPEQYEQMSQTVKVRRFWTPTVRTLVAELETAQARRDDVLQDVTRQVFAKFGQDYPLWAQAVACVAELDCLISLALVSTYQDGASCRPRFVSYEETGGHALLELRDAVHPSLAQSGASLGAYASAPTQFIPNDTDLGSEQNPARFVLISGPNMGGKSTLLRQVCCAVIMAQIGCYVAAKSCRLTPVDRIFTRVGANDRIMQGQSTFLVELEETATILRHASPRSLVILDELGRGTSTFDGTSIAHAVIEHLVARVKCLALFSTHYHMLLEEFRTDPRVAMYHMACQVRARGAQPGAGASAEAATKAAVEDGDNVDVTFLYKFVPGVCSKSFGMNVATLAGLPRALVMRAKAMSEMFEERLALAHKVAPADDSDSAKAAKMAAARMALAKRAAAALARRDMAEVVACKSEAKTLLEAH